MDGEVKPIKRQWLGMKGHVAGRAGLAAVLLAAASGILLPPSKEPADQAVPQLQSTVPPSSLMHRNVERNFGQPATPFVSEAPATPFVSEAPATPFVSKINEQAKAMKVLLLCLSQALKTYERDGIIAGDLKKTVFDTVYQNEDEWGSRLDMMQEKGLLSGNQRQIIAETPPLVVDRLIPLLMKWQKEGAKFINDEQMADLITQSYDLFEEEQKERARGIQEAGSDQAWYNLQLLKDMLRLEEISASQHRELATHDPVRLDFEIILIEKELSKDNVKRLEGHVFMQIIGQGKEFWQKAQTRKSPRPLRRDLPSGAGA